jgi:hypothetical protein
LLSFWKITINSKEGKTKHLMLKIAVDEKQKRASWIEAMSGKLPNLAASNDLPELWKENIKKNKIVFQEIIHRDLVYKGIIAEGASYSAEPLAFCGIGG